MNLNIDLTFNWMIAIIVISTLIITLSIFLIFYIKNNRKKKEIKKQILSYNGNKIINEFKEKVKEELYIEFNYDKEVKEIKFKRVAKEVLLIIVLDFILVLSVFNINLFSFILLIPIIYFTLKIYLFKIKSEERINILNQIPDLIIEMKNFYYENRMILSSLEEALKNTPYEISEKGREILNVLTSTNVRYSLNDYNIRESNIFLKLLANLLYITMEYGDIKKESKSLFVTNLNYLLEDINIEITRIKKLKIKFTGLIFTALFPIVFVNFIEKWSVTNFETLNEFYNSALGFIIRVLIVFVTLIVIGLITFVEYENSFAIMSPFKKGNSSHEHKTKYNIIKEKNKKRFDKIVKFIKPNKNEKIYRQILNLIEESKVKDTLDDIYSKKIIYFMVSLFFISVICLRLNTYINDLTIPIILMESILIVVISFIFYNVPNFMMSFRKIKMKELINEEVYSFNIIILMFLNYERTTVEFILEYMEKFSISCSNAIEKCILNLQKDKTLALAELKDSIPNKDFKRIIRNLILASRSISIKEAFDFLETDRGFSKETKILVNETKISKKVNLAQMLSFIPYYTIVLLYFVFPIIKEGIEKISEIILQIKNI